MKKYLTLLIAFIMSAMPAYGETAEVVGDDFSVSQYGYVAPSWTAGPLVKNGIEVYSASALPEKYDSRSRGIIKEPSNQQSEDICWAMSSTSVAETAARLFLGKSDADYSENHLKFISSRYAADGTWQRGFEREPEGGGNFQMATACYMRGDGPVNEADEPFIIGAPKKTLAQLRSYKSAAQITGAVFMPSNSSIEDIKRAIMDYGSVTMAMYWSSSYAGASRTNYYYNGKDGANHQITLVGWDDTYSRDNFKNTPASDGAFLVKNSWGTSVHINGYFWLSYEDSHIGSSAGYISGISEKVYDNVYQYDPFGFVGEVTLGTTARFYNRFDLEKPQKLSAVSLFTPNHNVNYKIYLNTADGRASGIDTSRPVASGHIDYSGYYLIEIEDRYLSGSEFIVMAELTSCSGESVKVPLEFNVKDSGGNEYIEQAEHNANEGYYYNGGWNDAVYIGTGTDADGNTIRGVSICLKAYTDNVSYSGEESFRVTYTDENGTALKAPGDGKITVTAEVSGGENMLMLAAVYDENGLLCDIKTADITGAAAAAEVNGRADGYVKAFVFNKQNLPEPVFENAGILNGEYNNPQFLNDTLIMHTGDIYYINVDCGGSNAAHAYEYTSADETTASVSGGKITAVKTGETDIVSSFGGKLHVVVQ